MIVQNLLPAPVNANASDSAKRLYAYLKAQYGTATIAGQMDTSWGDSADMVAKVFASTGKYPAIKGFDFLNVEVTGYTGSGCADEQTYEALAWWNGRSGSDVWSSTNYTSLGSKVSDAHGIVAFCWHWRVPTAAGGTSDPDSDEFYTSKTSFRVPMNGDGTLNASSTDFATIVTDVDKVAAQLQILEDNDVPVLWRPLHEASGGWFWWGAARSDGVAAATACKALYVWLYDYLTNTKGLNNLIWVWNGQSADWYPGDSYVDIAGDDIYDTPRDYSSKIEHFTATRDALPNRSVSGGNRMIALTENGTIPSPANIYDDGAIWSWFMTWNDGNTSGTNEGNFWEGTWYNDEAHKNTVYGSARVITLDELPDLDTYSY